MSNKRGGVSYNNSVNSKTGIKDRFRCSLCGRAYKQEWSLKTHGQYHKYCGVNNGITN